MRAARGCFFINMNRRVTAIEPQKKDSGRVNIYLDGEFAFGLSSIVAAWLRVGQELSDEKIASLKADEAGESAYQKALHFLSFRPRSSAEVRRNLMKRGIPEPLVEGTISRLQAAGLVNDQEFARAWIENRSTFRPRSRAALRIELLRKGIDREVISSALDESADEETLALEAARRYSRRLAGLDWREYRQKLGGFLARRGFSYEIAAPIVSKVWKENQTADNGDNLENEDRK